MSRSHSATVSAAKNFNPEKAAEALKNAFKGIGTNEEAIIDVLGSHNNEQRREIAAQYKTMYGQDLVADIKSELGGHFEEVCIGLLDTPAEFLAKQLYHAMKGAGTDEPTLIEILCSCTNEEMEKVKDSYKKLYDKELEDAVTNDVSGDFKCLLISLITARRDESQTIDREETKNDAEKLFQAGLGIGTDESVFNSILNSRNYRQLRKLFEIYPEVANCEIEETIKGEFSGYIEDGYMTIVKLVRNKQEYFADYLNKSFKGLGTNDKALIRIIISRSEIDLQDIKKIYAQKYEKLLGEAIMSECSGDYCRILLKLVGAD